MRLQQEVQVSFKSEYFPGFGFNAASGHHHHIFPIPVTCMPPDLLWKIPPPQSSEADLWSMNKGLQGEGEETWSSNWQKDIPVVESKFLILIFSYRVITMISHPAPITYVAIQVCQRKTHKYKKMEYQSREGICKGSQGIHCLANKYYLRKSVLQSWKGRYGSSSPATVKEAQ